MLTVQFAGPQNLSSCPERRGAREGGRASPRTAQGSKTPEMRNQPATLPRREARPIPVPSPGRWLPRVTALISAPRCRRELQGRSPGKAETWQGRRIQPRKTTCSCSEGSWAQISRAFLPSAHFTRPVALHAELGAPSHRQSFPLGPSLPCLAQLSGSSIAAAPALSLANHEPAWWGLHLAFSILVLSAQQSEGKTPTKKTPLKNFSATTLKHPLVLPQLRP